MRRCLVLLLAVAAAPPARGDVSGGLSLSAMALGETTEKGGAESDASPHLLVYGDLRGFLAARKLRGGIELRGDFRLRLAGNFDEAAALRGDRQITARGYERGREYELREAWLGRRGEAFDLAVGRLIVREADALLLDGARLSWRFHPAWHVALYGGLAPNPFSRSLTTDYPALAGGGGADAAYTYSRVRGWLSLSGLYFAGPDDGGAIDAAKPTAPPERREAPRLYATWSNFIQAASWLSLHHELVVDFSGAAGPQVTRAIAGAAIDLPRFRLAVDYAHLSSLAIEQYLARLLGDRRTFQLGTIENDLVVQRTARDEGRLRAAVRLARLDLYAEGRLRRRALFAPADDPNFKDAPAELAGDVTIGARDQGDLLALRLGAWFTELLDYRGETQLVGVELGRDFAGALAIDLAYLFERVRDFGAAPEPPCDTSPPKTPLTIGTLKAGCWGRRTGHVHQLGATLAIRPGRRLFLLADYRFVLDGSDGGTPIHVHTAYARVEVRF